MARITFKRGTRAQLDSAAGSSGLNIGEPYYITDQQLFAVGISSTQYFIVKSNLNPLAFQYEAENLNDSSGNAPNLSLSGTVPLVAGKTGNAFRFTANANNRLSVPAGAAGHTFGNKDWFLAMWVKCSVINQSFALYAKDAFQTSKRVLFLGTTPNVFRAGVGNGTNNSSLSLLDSTTAYTAGAWNHVLYAHQAESELLTLYINNVLEASSIGYPGLADPPGDSEDLPAYIGIRNSGVSFDAPANADIDQVVKGSFFPSASQRLNLYNQGAGVFSAKDAFV